MATKPTTLPEWASSPTADVAEPTTGRKQLGHVHGESPTAQEENWYKRTVYRWAEYLRDGALSGAHTIAGALTATTVTSTGNTTVGGDAAIVGTVTAAGVEVEVWGNGSAITVDAIIATASGSNLVASASASPGSGWTTITVTEASILANWGPTRQTITPPDAMLLKITIAASGARIRRCSILCDES